MAPGACKGCVSDTLGRMASLLMWMGLLLSIPGPKYAILLSYGKNNPVLRRNQLSHLRQKI